MSVKEVFRYMEAVESSTGPASTDARAIAMVVARRSHDGSVWLSREEIGDAVLLGSVATRRALRELVRAGWLVEEHKPGRSRWSLAFPEQRPDTLAAARDRRRRTPSRPINGSKAGDQRLEGFDGKLGSTARRLGDQRLEGLVINGSKATPPGSPPKTPTADPPSGSDPGSSGKLIQPESGSPREVPPAPILQPAPSGRPAKDPAQPRRRQRPETWTPSLAHREKARTLGFGEQRTDLEAEKFRDHHDARGSLFVDWDAAFSTWLRNARAFDDQRGVPREEPDDPLFADRANWVKIPPKPTRTAEEQAEIDRIVAEGKAMLARVADEHSMEAVRRRQEAERQAALARETNPELLAASKFLEAKRAEFQRQREAAREVH